MPTEKIHIVLTDDDEGDRLLFGEALIRVPVSTEFTALSGGEQLMKYFSTSIEELPDVVFLDLNMPKVSGFDCLRQMKHNERLRSVPVIICSTSGDERSIDETFVGGAHLYIIKPSEFNQLIEAIHQSLLMLNENFVQLPKENFVLNKKSYL